MGWAEIKWSILLCQNGPETSVNQPSESLLSKQTYSAVSIKNIDILPNRQYKANTADSAQERYSY